MAKNYVIALEVLLRNDKVRCEMDFGIQKRGGSFMFNISMLTTTSQQHCRYGNRRSVSQCEPPTPPQCPYLAHEIWEIYKLIKLSPFTRYAYWLSISHVSYIIVKDGYVLLLGANAKADILISHFMYFFNSIIFRAHKSK